MKRYLGFLVATLFTFAALAGFEAWNGTSNLKIFNSIKCSTGLTCAREGDKLKLTNANSLAGAGSGSIVGFLQAQLDVSSVATAVTLGVTACGGTFVSSTSTAQTVTIPSAASALGCRLTFVVGSATALTVNPAGTERILLLTNAGGDAIQADAAGESIMLESISTSQWAPIGAEKGTWTDIN